MDFYSAAPNHDGEIDGEWAPGVPICNSIAEMLSALAQSNPEEPSQDRNPKRERTDDEELELRGEICWDPDLDKMLDKLDETVPPMEQKSANIEFRISGINIEHAGEKYLKKLERRFKRCARKEPTKWVPKQTKSDKKKSEPLTPVNIKGGQLFINVDGKPSVRIFPQHAFGKGKMTIQGPTRQAIDARAEEMLGFLRPKYPECEIVFDHVLTSTYCGHIVDSNGIQLTGLKLQALNDILRGELKRRGLNTSFLNTEKDNCVTIYMKDVGENVVGGDASKCGQFRIFASGKATGFGVKSFETLEYHWKVVTQIIWDHLDAVTVEYVAKKAKTGTKRMATICSVCKQSGHNKRTCTKKE